MTFSLLFVCWSYLADFMNYPANIDFLNNFSEDRRNGIEPGFGATINIINGGLECNTKDGRESKQALNR